MSTSRSGPPRRPLVFDIEEAVDDMATVVQLSSADARRPKPMPPAAPPQPVEQPRNVDWRRMAFLGLVAAVAMATGAAIRLAVAYGTGRRPAAMVTVEEAPRRHQPHIVPSPAPAPSPDPAPAPTP